MKKIVIEHGGEILYQEIADRPTFTIVLPRVLSGTHKDLKQAVAAGTFREDLYYRLNVVPIKVPSLRERPEDIPLLVSFFVQRICERNHLKHKTLEEDVVWELQRYHATTAT